MSNAPAKSGKPKVEFNPRELTRFSRDSEGGPSVRFERASNGTLHILVEGRRVLVRKSLAAQEQSQPVALRYTTAEWEAFIQGVRAGEFDGYTSGSQEDLIPMRDSKDPDGPILAFTVAQMKPFINAVRSGKYYLPD